MRRLRRGGRPGQPGARAAQENIWRLTDNGTPPLHWTTPAGWLEAILAGVFFGVSRNSGTTRARAPCRCFSSNRNFLPASLARKQR